MSKSENSASFSLKDFISKPSLFDYKTSSVDAFVNTKLLHELTDDEQISIISDAMFKTMLANNKRKRYVAKILAGFFKRDFDEIYNNLSFYRNELNREAVDSKGERCDLLLHLGDDYILIEMNNKDESLRNVEYSDRVYNSKIRVSDKEYVYPIVLTINLNNFSYNDHDKAIDIYYVQNDEGEILVNKIYVQIYIPLLKKKWYTFGEESLDEFEKSLLVMATTERRKALELAKGDSILEEYVKDAKESEQYDNYLKEAYDHELSQIQAGEMRGEERGRKEERTQARKETIETIKELIKDGFDKDILVEKFKLTNEEQKQLD